MKDIDWMILKTVYEKGSITKAAEALYMTQSAVTKRIRSIEEEWDVQVVERTPRGVKFTEDGTYLVKKANIMLDFLGEIRDRFKMSGAVKTLLKMGVPNSFSRLHMPELLKEYIHAYNKIQFSLISNSSDVIMQQLTDGTIDLGIVCGDYPYLGEKERLFREELYIATPQGMKLDEIDGVPLIEFYYNPMVRQTITQWWKGHFGSMPRSEHFVPNADIAIEMVKNGLGICFLFGTRWKKDNEEIQLIPVYDHADHPVGRNVWMMISERCYKNPDIMDFIGFVENYYKTDEALPDEIEE